MFDDFKNAVVDSYLKKKKANELSENLVNPSRARLRKECLFILKKRYLPKDDKVIKAFFDPDSKFNNHELSIRRLPLDGFQSLRLFFSGQSGVRREENINLIAWLINFEPRPYHIDNIYNSDGEEKNNPEELKEKDLEPEIEIRDNGIPTENLIAVPNTHEIGPVSQEIDFEDEKKKQRKKLIIRYSILSLIVLICTSGGVYIASNINQQCMYWNGDHYEPISCNKTMPDKYIIAMDKKATSFKKIMRPDTLTSYSIGKVFYMKIHADSVEFYTGDGNYPLDNRRRLRPLTYYMLNKYVFLKRTLN
jgi:hypothetical protein